MKLIQRLRFAVNHDFERDFVVYSIPDQTAMRFLKYEDALAFSQKQIQYRPKILVEITK